MLARQPTPALAEPLRRPAVGVAAVAAAGFTVLGIRYAGVVGHGTLDSAAEAAITPWLAQHAGVLRRIVFLADPQGVVVAAALIAVACVLLRRRRLAVVAVLGPLVTGLATTGLQPLIGRTHDGGFALPSGHAGGATAIAVVAALIAVSFAVRRLWTGVALAAVAVLAVAAVMTVGLIVNDFHYLTDAVAGFCTGVAFVLATAMIVDAVADRVSTAKLSGGR